MPGVRTEVAQVRVPAGGSCVGERVEGRVDVEVGTLLGPDAPQPTEPGRRGPSVPHPVEDEARRKPAGLVAPTSSVAWTMSASSVTAASRSSTASRPRASSSMTPTSGETSAKFGRRDSSARPTVREVARFLGCGEVGPSRRGGGDGLRLPPAGVPCPIMRVVSRRRVGPEDAGVELGDDGLGRAAAGLREADPARERDEGRVEADPPVVGRGAPEPGQRRRDLDEVDRAAHRRADPDVGVARVRRTRSTTLARHPSSTTTERSAVIRSSPVADWYPMAIRQVRS